MTLFTLRNRAGGAGKKKATTGRLRRLNSQINKGIANLKHTKIIAQDRICTRICIRGTQWLKKH